MTTKHFQNLLLGYLEYLFHDTSRLVYSAPKWMMEPNPEAILLDCGCNNGVYSRSLAELLGTKTVLALELNLQLAKEAQANNVVVLRTDLNAPIPFEADSVNVLTAFNVLEHLVETELFINEIYRIITPGGYAIINTPNLASWHNIFALLIGLQPFSGPNITSMTESDVPIIRRMHRRAHGLLEDVEEISPLAPERHRHIVVVAYRSLTKALRRAGFVIEHAVGYGYYPLPPFLARMMSHIDPWHAHHMVIKVRKPL